jgi:AcrR family transcriptional regulator
MNNMESGEDTRERILTEAEALFAERGYEAVSVREITKKAGCNLAAVNYHFGNKNNLYLEVFRSRVVPRAVRLQKVFRTMLNESERPDLKTLFRAMATAFLKGPLTDEERIAHHQLMAREVANPTEAFGIVAEMAMAPFFREVSNHIRPLLRDDLEDDKLVINIMSMFSQIMFFNFSRVSVSMLTGKTYDQEFVNTLIEHITEFTLHGFSLISKKEESPCVESKS